jgi:SAM-dependent methyltransferase
MISLKSSSRIMEWTTAYRLWQAPFQNQKFHPIRQYNDLAQVRRILDVGCGPGTNCPYFVHCDYHGIDLNPRYIEYARRRYGRSFAVADVTKYTVPSDQRFDFILLNSLLHHLAQDGCERILRQLPQVLTDDGHVHIVELVLPDEPGLPRFLALNDRGDYGRSLPAWEQMFSDFFQPVVVQPFTVRCVGLACWQLVYFKGLRK